MSKEFSKLDKAKLDLIRLQSRLEELNEMTLRDSETIICLENSILKKKEWIKELGG